MKKLLLVLALLSTGFLYGQEVQTKDGVRLELVSTDNGALVKYTKLDIEGNTVQEGNYLEGKPHGTWKMYNADGSVTTMKFKNGKRIVMNTTINGRETIVEYENNRPVVVVTKL